MYYAGIDLGGTTITVGLLDSQGDLAAMENIPTHREQRGHDGIVRDLAATMLAMLERIEVDVSDLECVGVGVPGIIDREKGMVLYASNLRFDNYPLVGEIRKHVDLPVYLENDANCAALAESAVGAARDVSNSITITLGTGIGGGVVIGGELYTGFNGAGGELGHMVIDSCGELCSCGTRGCWEAYASATALIKMAGRAVAENADSLLNTRCGGCPERIDAKMVFDAEKSGDEVAARVVGKYMKYLSEGLVNLVNIFAPEMIVIGGGISGQGESLLRRVRELVYKDMYFKSGPKAMIVKAELGDKAGITGAAMVGRESKR